MPPAPQKNLPTRNNNPGDLRDTSTGSFRQFPTVLDGYASLVNDVKAKQTGNTSTGLKPTSTLKDFANVYAPSSDNNDSAGYAKNLASIIGATPDTPIGQVDTHSLAHAIAMNEGYQGQLPNTMTSAELAQKIKTKYPQYQNLNDADLVQKITAKYPAYSAILSDTPTQNTQPEPGASISGFLGNTVQSGANFLGNLGQAALHPIQTIQNVGGAAVGGLQELGGQTNENTAKFDALKQYFIDRYKSPDALLHTAYSDPVGLAADLSTVFGVGGGVVGLAGKGAEAAGIAGAAETASNVASKLGKAAELTNPLTPVVKGANVLIESGKKFSDIVANPIDYTPENIAAATSEKVAADVEDAISQKIKAHSETGSGYNDIRNAEAERLALPSPTGKPITGGSISLPETTGTKIETVAREPQQGVLTNATRATATEGKAPATVKVAHNFLENQLRDVAKLDVKDGRIVPTTVSRLGKSDLTKLQDVFDTFKPAFAKGELTNEEFLNLRSRLADAAYNDNGIKNTNVAKIAEDLRNALNNEYRPSIKGLAERDLQYTAETNKLKELLDGIVYKTGEHKGEIKDSFINSALKAVKNNDTEKLAQLEELLPGITKRLRVMKTIKEMGSPGFTTTLVEKGGLFSGLATGNIHTIALAMSTMFLTQPEIAIPMLRATGASIPLVKQIMVNMARSLNTAAVVRSAESTALPKSETSQNTAQDLGQTTQQGTGTSGPHSSQQDITQLPGYQDARAAGYTDDEIRQYLGA